MSLAFLPQHHIRTCFEELEGHALASQLEPVRRYMTYFRRTWLEHSVWEPRNWSVYREATRTNNSLESWHNRINKRAISKNVGLYTLVGILFKEAKLVDLQVRIPTYLFG